MANDDCPLLFDDDDDDDDDDCADDDDDDGAVDTDADADGDPDADDVVCAFSIFPRRLFTMMRMMMKLMPCWFKS